MKDKISILIELEKILFDQEIEIISDTLEIRRSNLRFSYIDFLDIDRCLYFDSFYHPRNIINVLSNNKFGTVVPLFRDLVTNDLTYFLLQEQNSELRYFLKEVKLDTLVDILNKVKSYINRSLRKYSKKNKGRNKRWLMISLSINSISLKKLKK